MLIFGRSKTGVWRELRSQILGASGHPICTVEGDLNRVIVIDEDTLRARDFTVQPARWVENPVHPSTEPSKEDPS